MSVARLGTFSFAGQSRLAALAAAVTIMALLTSVVCAHAQVQAPTPPASAARAEAPKPKNLEFSSKPAWSKLTPAQQVALAPLAPAWSGISEAQKRKWIALSQNYPGLSDAERATLHGRMTEWAGLSPAQRSQARLNFAQTKQLSTEEKKTQWEAYQALSAEQKKQLASAGAKPKATGAAPAVTPVAANKLAAVPITRSEPLLPLGSASTTRTSASPRVAGAASQPVVQP